MTAESACAFATVRGPAHGTWLIVDALALVMYIYASALRRGETRIVRVSLCFFLLELMWEMCNALVLHFTDFAPLWSVRCEVPSMYVLYVGINLEIVLMFVMAPIVVLSVTQMPGLSPRWRQIVPVLFGVLCLAVETLLNRAGMLGWQWSFWRFPHLYLVLLVYAGPFWLLLQAHDRVSERALQRALPVIAAAALVSHLVLATWLGWI